MSFQKIRGGKSLGIAMEMFEYFKSGDINKCGAGAYVPAGTNTGHFIEVARALCGDLCEVRAHDVEKHVPEIGYDNRRHVEFYIEHEPREFESHELTRVDFKLTLIQYGDAGIWGFLGAELTKHFFGGGKLSTRYAMRKSIPARHRPHISSPRRLIFPGPQNCWWVMGMSCPLYIVSQEGEEVKKPTTYELMREMAGDD